MNNKMKLVFSSKSENESFARNVISCFVLSLNPSLAELSEIKTAVSEAVTNAIVHAYNHDIGEIVMEAEIIERTIHINIFDSGKGIENIDKALQPFYTTNAEEERSGMGFTIMQSFMDKVIVESNVGLGTKVYMTKLLKQDA